MCRSKWFTFTAHDRATINAINYNPINNDLAPARFANAAPFDDIVLYIDLMYSTCDLYQEP